MEWLARSDQTLQEIFRTFIRDVKSNPKILSPTKIVTPRPKALNKITTREVKRKRLARGGHAERASAFLEQLQLMREIQLDACGNVSRIMSSAGLRKPSTALPSVFMRRIRKMAAAQYPLLVRPIAAC